MKTKFEELKSLKEKLPFDELNGKISEELINGEISQNDARELFGLERIEDEALDKHLITLKELGNRLQKNNTKNGGEKMSIEESKKSKRNIIQNIRKSK